MTARPLNKRDVERDVYCYCHDCRLSFTSTGPASSHAASAKHRVDVYYRATWTWVPSETTEKRQ